jgi:hypothetical protein
MVSADNVNNKSILMFLYFCRAIISVFSKIGGVRLNLMKIIWKRPFSRYSLIDKITRS